MKRKVCQPSALHRKPVSCKNAAIEAASFGVSKCSAFTQTSDAAECLPNQTTPLLHRIVVRNNRQGQYYYNSHHSLNNANNGTESDRYALLEHQQPTISNNTLSCSGNKNNELNATENSYFTSQLTQSFTPISPLNTNRRLTLRYIFTSLFTQFSFASSVSGGFFYKKQDHHTSSSFEFVPISHKSTMLQNHSGNQQRQEDLQSALSSESLSNMNSQKSHNFHSYQFQTSSVEQKLLKSIRVYAFGICVIALLSTGVLVLVDRIRSPSNVTFNHEGDELTRITRVANDVSGNSSRQTSLISSKGNIHKLFHDEDFIAKLRDEFHEWISHHGREYSSDGEKEKRFHIWKENHIRTIEKNKKHGPCKLTGQQVFGSNHFKDLSPEEFKAKYLTGYNGPRIDEMDERHQRKLRRTSNIFEQQKPSLNQNVHEQTSDVLSSNGLHDPSMLSHRISRHEIVQERYLKHIIETPKLSKTYYNKEEKAAEKACKCGTTYKSQRRLASLFSRDTPLFGKTYYNKSEKQMLCGNNFSKSYYQNDNGNNYSSKNDSNNYHYNNNNSKNNSSNRNYNNSNSSKDNNTNNYYNRNNNNSHSNGHNNYQKNSSQQYKHTTSDYYSGNSSYKSQSHIDCSKYKLEADHDFDDLSNNRRKSTISCAWYDMTCWMTKMFTPLYASSESIYSNYNYPSSIDWRKIGAVTNVHNQGSCGACWAITATETIEAVNYISTGVLRDLAETEIIICEDSCEMCDGGWPQNAYEYVMENNGLPAESSSSYDGSFLMTMTMVTSGESDEMSENEIEYVKQTTCPAGDSSGDNNNSQNSSSTRYGAIKGWAYATDRCVCYTDGSGCDCEDQNEALAVMNVASYGPATVCLEASTWQDYTGGVITADNSGCTSAFLDMNHCVQVVGYSYKDVDSDGEDGHENENNRKKEGYWIVRNQWSSYWGMNGYAYVAMGGNTCGILNDMTQVFMDS